MTSKIDPDSFVTTPEIRARAQDAMAYLDAHPDVHNQTYWFRVKSAGDAEDNWKSVPVKFDEKGEPNICGTQMCLAGTVQFQEYGIKGLRKFNRNEKQAWTEAGELLGLGSKVAYRVFHQTGSNQIAREMLENISKGNHPYTGIYGWENQIVRAR